MFLIADVAGLKRKALRAPLGAQEAGAFAMGIAIHHIGARCALKKNGCGAFLLVKFTCSVT
jgi:hypothetical protein